MVGYVWYSKYIRVDLMNEGQSKAKASRVSRHK